MRLLNVRWGFAFFALAEQSFGQKRIQLVAKSLARFPHPQSPFTQGLEFLVHCKNDGSDGQSVGARLDRCLEGPWKARAGCYSRALNECTTLLESSGLYNKSYIRVIRDFDDGNAALHLDGDPRVFFEGLTFIDDQGTLALGTWQSDILYLLSYHANLVTKSGALLRSLGVSVSDTGGGGGNRGSDYDGDRAGASETNAEVGSEVLGGEDAGKGDVIGEKIAGGKNGEGLLEGAGRPSRGIHFTRQLRVRPRLQMWGLASDRSQRLWITNGTSYMTEFALPFPVQSQTISPSKTIQLRCRGAPVPYLNEIDYDFDRQLVWGNQFMTPYIYLFNPDSGQCEASFSLRENAVLLRHEREHGHDLEWTWNGIALLPNDWIVFTAKRHPSIYLAKYNFTDYR